MFYIGNEEYYDLYSYCMMVWLFIWVAHALISTSSLMLSRVTKFFERHKIWRYSLRNCLHSTVTLSLTFFSRVLCGNEDEGVHCLGTLTHRNPEFRSISNNGWALNSLCRYWPCDGILPHSQTSVQCVTEIEISSPLTKTAEVKIKYSWKINRRKKQR